MFEKHFFGKHASSRDAYATAINTTMEALFEAMPSNSYTGGSPEKLAKKLPPWRETGGSWPQAIADLKKVINNSVAVYHPHTCAHLQCPVLIPSLAAELVLTALNQSMDSFDQAPAATLIEQQVCEWITNLIGYNSQAAATFTTGGTQSNYFGLLLARDRWILDHWKISAQEHGLPAQAIGKMKILCSKNAHFSIIKSAHQLGLGSNAVVTIPVDNEGRMKPDALANTIARLKSANQEIFAVVTTAGTTDAGAIDPIPEITALCSEHGIWLHVDAAWGSALLLSKTHRTKLAGIEQADSVSLDFHKGFYQAVSCSAFAVKNSDNFKLVQHYADYLNPEEHTEQGVPDLVTNSLLTTRRFDSLKIWITLRVVGIKTLGEMIDQSLKLAAEVATQIESYNEFTLVCKPGFSSVLFRLQPIENESIEELEAIHAAIPSHLLHTSGEVIGFTKIHGKRVLKLTLLNPNTTVIEINVLLKRIIDAAKLLRNQATR